MDRAPRRVVAITGASAGIGAACASLLARRGAFLVLSARRIDQLEQVAAPLRETGARVETIQADVTRPEDMQALVNRARDAFGRLDVLICNAGIGYHGAIDGTSADVMRRLMDVNYMGTFHAIGAAMPVFRSQGSGHILIVSSIVGQRGIGFSSAYSATKAAQVGLAEGLRAELRGTGIHVSLVIPVSTRTEFHEAMRRDFGHAVSGRGPKQDASVVAGAIADCIEHPRAEVHPHKLSRVLVILNALAPAFTDRRVQKYGRGDGKSPSPQKTPTTRNST
ncbi:MAG: SDR family NAD(P)-dependent oxidoreductase [Acidobacteriota bacterium]